MNNHTTTTTSTNKTNKMNKMNKMNKIKPVQSSRSIETKLQNAGTNANVETTTVLTTSTTRQRRSLVMVMGNQEFQKFARDYKIAGGIVPHVNLHSLFERHCHYQQGEDSNSSSGSGGSSSSSSSRSSSHTGNTHSLGSTGSLPRSRESSSTGCGVVFFSEFQSALLELAEDAYNDINMEKNVHSSTYCLGKLLLHIDGQQVGSSLSAGNKFKGLTKLIKSEKSKRKPKSNHGSGSTSGDNNEDRGSSGRSGYISSQRSQTSGSNSNSEGNLANRNNHRSNGSNGRNNGKRTTLNPHDHQNYHNHQHRQNTPGPIAAPSTQHQGLPPSHSSSHSSQRNVRTERLAMTAPRERTHRTVRSSSSSSSSSSRGIATAHKPSFRGSSSGFLQSSFSEPLSFTSQSKTDGRVMHRMLSTLFGHFGRKQLDGSLTMKTFLRLAKASNIVQGGQSLLGASSRSSSRYMLDEKEESEDGSMITIKRLRSIVERVQAQYGNAGDTATGFQDRLRFSMSCAVLLRVARCQYLYRAEFLGSKGSTEILDATAFGALCREKLAPLYMHMMVQLGSGGDRETNHITVEGSTYLLNRSKIACQTNQLIALDDGSAQDDQSGQSGHGVGGSERRMNVGPFSLSDLVEPTGIPSMMMMSGGSSRGRSRKNSEKKRSSSSSRKSDKRGVDSGGGESWEDVVRQLRNANHIADGLLVGTPSGKGTASGSGIGSGNGGGGGAEEGLKLKLEATTDAALQLEAENQELRRLILMQSSHKSQVTT